MDVFKLAAARPNGILALLFFHRNVATSGPIFTIVERISGWSNSICGLSVSV